jgi:hypothetical protein
MPLALKNLVFVEFPGNAKATKNIVGVTEKVAPTILLKWPRKIRGLQNAV